MRAQTQRAKARRSDEVLWFHHWVFVIGSNGKFEIYDFEADPAEVKDLAAKYLGRVNGFKNRLKAHSESITANKCQAGFVLEAKFPLNESGKTPKLRYYLELSDVEAIQRNYETKE